jgi:hypothetical protein
VGQRKDLLTAERFTMKILAEIFYRDYGSYYFERRCQDYLEAKSIVESVRIDTEIWKWIGIWYGRKQKAREKALQMIKQIGEILSEEISVKLSYNDDENNPTVEVWRWNLIVPVWRIVFEYKRMMIDKRLEEEKRLKNEEISENLNNDVKPTIMNTIDEEKKVVIDRKKSEPIELKFKCKTSDRKVNIIVKPVNNNKEIPPTILIKTDDEYKVESQDETYQKIYMKKGEDDPVFVIQKLLEM